VTRCAILAGALVTLAGCHPVPLVLGAAVLGFGTRALQLDTAVITALTPKPVVPAFCAPAPIGMALNGDRQD
jgi:hypothetical protein